MAQTGLRIRDVAPVELDEVSRTIGLAYQEYAAHFSPETWQHYFREVTNVRRFLTEAEVLVAERAGRIMGTVTFYPDRSRWDAAWPRRWAAVRALAVPPQERGQGIARALMEESLRRAREHHAPVLGLRTVDFMHAARTMYRAMGFAHAPELDIHYHDLLVLAYRRDLF